jgi:hypothetical protein
MLSKEKTWMTRDDGLQGKKMLHSAGANGTQTDLLTATHVAQLKFSLARKWSQFKTLAPWSLNAVTAQLDGGVLSKRLSAAMVERCVWNRYLCHRPDCASCGLTTQTRLAYFAPTRAASTPPWL